jgi:hypothetical protein
MSDARGGISLAEGARAQRFQLRIPLRYRSEADGDWHRGASINISRSGMLFHGEHWVEPRARLEMALFLPQQPGADRAAELVCRGTVMRSERSGIEKGDPLIAIVISHYRLLRPQDGQRASGPADC